MGARMTEARRRLLIPRTSLESIAISLGFTSTEGFSKAFTRFVGTRPSIYRARLGVQGEVRRAKQQLVAIEPLSAEV